MRITKKSFEAKAKIIHNNRYDYSLVEYENTSIKVKIVCIAHGIFLQSPHNHLSNHGCPKCGIDTVLKKCRKTLEIFIQEANKRHNGIYTYEKFNYINATTNGIITCVEHGDFEQRPQHHLDGHGCPICGVEKRSVQRRKSIDIFIEQANKIHSNIYDYSKSNYINSSIKITIICVWHGNFKQSPAAHLKGQGCPECGKEKSAAMRRKTQTEFIMEASAIHDNVYAYNEFVYINDTIKGTIICAKHGKFLQTPSNHLRGQGCPACINKNEAIILRCMQQLGIEYKYQYPIIIDGKRLVVDFYLPTLNTIVEYNGRQHYECMPMWFPLQEDAEKELVKQINRDNILLKYCNDNGIASFIVDGRIFKFKKLKAYIMKTFEAR